MRKVYTHYFLLLYLLLLSFIVEAQDPHFSQPMNAQMLTNPAYTGLFSGKVRLSMMYRNQWATVANPFQTYALTVEAAPLKRRYQRDGIGIGLNFTGDVAGTSRYGMMEGGLSLSYFKSLNNRKHHFLSFGLQGGYGQMGFSTENLDFPTGGNAELFENTQVQYPTVGLGIGWQYEARRELFFQAGIAAFHLNQPFLEYFLGHNSRLHTKYTANVQTQIRYWDKFALIPAIYSQLQNNTFEILYGSDFKWFLAESSREYFTLSAGLYFRQGDAFILALKSEYNAWQFSISYDANVSSLWKSSRTVGAFELTVSYIFGKTRVLRQYEIPCPVF